MKEILIKVDNNIFGARVYGVCFYNNNVLIKRNKNGAFTFPGGNIGFNEISKDALLRKLSEETDAVFHISDVKIISEDIITSVGSPCHEICFYYKITLLDKNLLLKTEFSSSKNTDEVFVWFPIDKLKTIKLKPKNATEIIDRIFEDNITHIVN